MLPAECIEIDWCLAGGGDIDHASAGIQQRQQALRQQIGCQCVDREADIEPIRCSCPGGLEDPGIVDQHIQFAVLVGYSLGECFHLGQLRQVGDVTFNAPGTGEFGKCLLCLFQLLRIPAVQQNMMALGDEQPGCGEADTVGGTGDEDGFGHGRISFTQRWLQQRQSVRSSIRTHIEREWPVD